MLAVHVELERRDRMRDERFESKEHDEGFNSLPLLKLSLVAVLSAAVCFAMTACSSSGIAGLIGGSPLNEQVIASAIEDEVASCNPSYDSEWIEPGEFSITSQSVGEVSDVEPDENEKQVHVTVVKENDSVKATQVFNCLFDLSDDGWSLDDIWLVKDSVEPIAGIDSEKIIEHAPTLIRLSDDGNHEFSDGAKCRLDDVYSQGAEFSVAKNNTDENGGTVEMTMAATTGFVSYDGRISVAFAWGDDESGWTIESCEASESSYKPNYETMIGEWNGEFVRASNSKDRNVNCYGGRENPPNLVVKSADSQAGVITADLTFLAHRHYPSDNSVSSSEGDEQITLEDILIPVPPLPGKSVTAYTQKPPQKGYEFTQYEIDFTYESTGEIQVGVEYTWGENDDGETAWYTDTYFDDYKLSKA